MAPVSETTGLMQEPDAGRPDPEDGGVSMGEASSSQTPTPRRRWGLAVALTGALALGSLALYNAASGRTAAPPATPSSSSLNKVDAESVEGKKDTSDLEFVVHRAGYKTVEQATRQSYGFDHIIEPYASNHFTVTNPKDEHSYFWTITHNHDGSTFREGKGEVWEVDKTIFTGTNQWYTIEVVEKYHGKETGRTGSSSRAVTRYVRREIRHVRDGDIEKYLEAMHTVFTVGWEEGRNLYGKDYRPHSYFAELHCSSTYSYHGNLLFTTSHPSMLIMFERSLTAVDPEIVLLYYDFMLDAQSEDWTQLFVFDKNMFGTAKNGPEVDYRPQGRFHDVENVMYHEATMAGVEKNVYGYLTDSYSNVAHLQRTNYYCGFHATEGFSGCAKLRSCFEDWIGGSSFHDFDSCMEKKCHGELHAMFGGMWNCAVDLSEVYEEHKSWLGERLLSFLANNFVDMYIAKNLEDNDFYCHPGACSSEDTFKTCHTRACKSTGIRNVHHIDEMTTEQVFAYIRHPLASMHLREYDAEEFIYRDESDTSLTYKFKGLSEDQNSIVYRLLLKIMAYPGLWGPFNSCAASNDPFFWVAHQVFDRAIHSARLSSLSSAFNYSWTPVDDDQGVGWLSTTPFEGQIFKLEDGDRALTNKELFYYLDPKGDKIEYVYDHVFSFGECDFMDLVEHYS